MKHDISLSLEFILTIEADTYKEAQEIVRELDSEELLSIALDNVEDCETTVEQLH